MPKLLSTVACNLDPDILAACLPLLQESRVEALEWSFDALFNVANIPAWFLDLLHAFGKEKRLIGHGIFFSLFSGKWSQHQKEWLEHLKHTSANFGFDHVTEHFGFMTGKDFHHGAPLSIPYTKTTLQIGRDRLQRIAAAAACPVGLENLAFSYSLDEVKKHGEFLERLIEPVNGFIILDLHNLYCQMHNFSIGYDDIIGLYPLDKVREIHISGGSWEPASSDDSRLIRRDTHDDAVPKEVFELLDITVDKCSQLKYVVMEQLGNGLKTKKSRKVFYKDFLQMEKIVQQHNKTRHEHADNTFLPVQPHAPGTIIESEDLYTQQIELSSILENAEGFKAADRLLKKSSLANSDWEIEKWQPYMIETAMQIAQKWKKPAVSK